MRSWQLKDAQKRLPTLLEFCIAEPQIICDDEHAVGVIVDLALFQDMYSLWMSQKQPTIDDLLNELDEIKLHEPIEIEISPRTNRFNVANEDPDAVPV